MAGSVPAFGLCLQEMEMGVDGRLDIEPAFQQVGRGMDTQAQTDARGVFTGAVAQVGFEVRVQRLLAEGRGIERVEQLLDPLHADLDVGGVDGHGRPGGVREYVFNAAAQRASLPHGLAYAAGRGGGHGVIACRAARCSGASSSV
jgi:hypothetical protein